MILIDKIDDEKEDPILIGLILIIDCIWKEKRVELSKQNKIFDNWTNWENNLITKGFINSTIFNHHCFYLLSNQFYFIFIVAHSYSKPT